MLKNDLKRDRFGVRVDDTPRIRSLETKAEFDGHDDSNRFGRVGTWTELRRGGAISSVPDEEWSQSPVWSGLLYVRAVCESHRALSRPGLQLGKQFVFLNSHETLNNPNLHLKFEISNYLHMRKMDRTSYLKWDQLRLWSYDIRKFDFSFKYTVYHSWHFMYSQILTHLYLHFRFIILTNVCIGNYPHGKMSFSQSNRPEKCFKLVLFIRSKHVGQTPRASFKPNTVER